MRKILLCKFDHESERHVSEIPSLRRQTMSAESDTSVRIAKQPTPNSNATVPPCHYRHRSAVQYRGIYEAPLPFCMIILAAFKHCWIASYRIGVWVGKLRVPCHRRDIDRLWSFARPGNFKLDIDGNTKDTCAAQNRQDSASRRNAMSKDVVRQNDTISNIARYFMDRECPEIL